MCLIQRIISGSKPSVVRGKNRLSFFCIKVELFWQMCVFSAVLRVITVSGSYGYTHVIIHVFSFCSFCDFTVFTNLLCICSTLRRRLEQTLLR